MNNKDKWLIVQQHKKDYCLSDRDKQWKISYSLNYWKKFLHIKKLQGIGIEVGCGSNGLYNFTEKVIGIDPINYKKKNFIVGVAEFLLFKKVDYTICCNGIDHFKDIDKSLKEILSVTNRIIIWTNVFPLIISYILSTFNKIHLYHLIKDDIMKSIIKHNLSITFFKINNLFSIHGKYASKKAKLKLFFASCLGIKGFCLHLEVEKN